MLILWVRIWLWIICLLHVMSCKPKRRKCTECHYTLSSKMRVIPNMCIFCSNFWNQKAKYLRYFGTISKPSSGNLKNSSCVIYTIALHCLPKPFDWLLIDIWRQIRQTSKQIERSHGSFPLTSDNNIIVYLSDVNALSPWLMVAFSFVANSGVN